MDNVELKFPSNVWLMIAKDLQRWALDDEDKEYVIRSKIQTVVLKKSDETQSSLRAN